MAARQLDATPPIGLHPVPGLDRNQRRRHHVALDAQFAQLPVEYVTRRTGFIASPQMLHRPKLLDQLADRFRTVSNRSQAAYLAVRLGYSDRNRLGMDIQTQKSYLFLHDRFSSACGSELCLD